MVRGITVHDFFDHVAKVSDATMHRICGIALTKQSCAYDDHLFFHAEVSSVMYFVVSGKLNYTPHQGAAAQTKQSVECRQWICEPALWTNWRHRGDCFAAAEVDMLALSAECFAEIVKNSPKVWHFAIEYAQGYIKTLNDMDLNASDTTAAKRVAVFKRPPGRTSTQSQSAEHVVQKSNSALQL